MAIRILIKRNLFYQAIKPAIKAYGIARIAIPLTQKLVQLLKIMQVCILWNWKDH
jgi:hypothetical protein